MHAFQLSQKCAGKEVLNYSFWNFSTMVPTLALTLLPRTLSSSTNRLESQFLWNAACSTKRTRFKHGPAIADDRTCKYPSGLQPGSSCGDQGRSLYVGPSQSSEGRFVSRRHAADCWRPAARCRCNVQHPDWVGRGTEDLVGASQSPQVPSCDAERLEELGADESWQLCAASGAPRLPNRAYKHVSSAAELKPLFRFILK